MKAILLCLSTLLMVASCECPYQDELEREWVADLRRRYSFSVNTEVLKTVNNHDSH